MVENIVMTKSQKKLYDFYKKNTNTFENVLSISKLDNGVVIISTNNLIYSIGKLGGLTCQFKKK
jgi:hypothetical protein